MRTGRLRSIRLRLMVPIGLAAVGLFVLGAVQTETAVRAAQGARRAEAVASTAIVTVRLEHQLEQEAAEADGLRSRGGTAGAALLTAAQAQTDLAVTNFRSVSAGARRFAPSLTLALNAAEAQLSTLAVIRANVAHLPADAISGDSYDKLNESLLAVAGALPGQLDDADLAARARAIAALAAVEHLGSEQRDLLHQVFRRGGFAAGEQAELAGLVGAQDERIAEFQRNATAADLADFAKQSAGTDAATAAAMRGAVLQPVPDSASLHADADAWYIAQSNALRRLHTVNLDLSHALGQTANARQAAAANRALGTSLGTAGLIGLAFGAALFFAVRTSRRLRRLRRAALGVANLELPGAIASLTGASDPMAVRDTLQESANRAQALSVAGTDEIGEVGAALSTLHRQALRLAADQALLRLDVEALFVALSRRGQTLIQRQLQLIDQYERAETDQKALYRLYALDHLAARMRRNEENLLVLAGGEPGRRIWNPVPLVEVIEAAAAEIEDRHRVQAAAVADVAIVAHAVRDVVHLLAELLENATAYSPPSSKVAVSARRTVDSVTVTVFDEGIGMAADQLTELNRRLVRPTMLTAELAGTMGLLVVARLAARHGISVELRSSPGQGTAALVALPIAVLAPTPAPSAVSDLGIRPEPRQLPPTGTTPVSGAPISGVPVSPAPAGRLTPLPLRPVSAAPRPTNGPSAPSTPAAPGGMSIGPSTSGGAVVGSAASGGSSIGPSASGGFAVGSAASGGSSVGSAASGGSSVGPVASGGSSVGPVASGGSSVGPAASVGPETPGGLSAASGGHAGPVAWAAPAAPAGSVAPAGSGTPDTLTIPAAPGAPGTPSAPVAPGAQPGPPPASTVGGATAAGLPRRMPGGLLLSGHAVSPQELAGVDDGTRPPDPDDIRARLSGLASGLAQAARQTQARP